MYIADVDAMNMRFIACARNWNIRGGQRKQVIYILCTIAVQDLIAPDI